MIDAHSDCPIDEESVLVAPASPTPGRRALTTQARINALLLLVGPGPTPRVPADPTATGRLRGLCE